MSTQGSAPRKFVQTFVLAPQINPQGFYVLNDVLRFIKDDIVVSTSAEESPADSVIDNSQPVAHTHSPAPAVASPTTPPLAATSDAASGKQTVSAAKEESPAQNHRSNTHAHASAPSQHAHSETTATTTTTTEAAPAEKRDGKEKTNHVAKTTPSSWASLLHGAGGEGANPSTPAAEDIMLPPVKEAKKPKQRKEKAPRAEGEPGAPKDTHAAKEHSPKEQSIKSPKFVVGPHSLYASNIPFGMTEEQVRDLFEHIEGARITTLVYKAERGFAFIECPDAASAQVILDRTRDKQMLVQGRPLIVEERRQKAAAPAAPFKKTQRPAGPPGGGGGYSGKPNPHTQPRETHGA